MHVLHNVYSGFKILSPIFVNIKNTYCCHFCASIVIALIYHRPLKPLTSFLMGHALVFQWPHVASSHWPALTGSSASPSELACICLTGSKGWHVEVLQGPNLLLLKVNPEVWGPAAMASLTGFYGCWLSTLDLQSHRVGSVFIQDWCGWQMVGMLIC